jgi:hypothetical protein
MALSNSSWDIFIKEFQRLLVKTYRRRLIDRKIITQKGPTIRVDVEALITNERVTKQINQYSTFISKTLNEIKERCAELNGIAKLMIKIDSLENEFELHLKSCELFIKSIQNPFGTNKFRGNQFIDHEVGFYIYVAIILADSPRRQEELRTVLKIGGSLNKVLGNDIYRSIKIPSISVSDGVRWQKSHKQNYPQRFLIKYFRTVSADKINALKNCLQRLILEVQPASGEEIKDLYATLDTYLSENFEQKRSRRLIQRFS